MIFDKTINSIKKLRKITLNEKESETMKKEFARLSGIPMQAFNTQPVRSDFVFDLRYASFAGAMTLLLVTSMSFAAEGALPGDILYPIKTKINESVMRSVAGASEVERIETETLILERRLEEAEKLDKDDRLTDELRVNLRMEIHKQIDRAVAKEDKEVETEVEVMKEVEVENVEIDTVEVADVISNASTTKQVETEAETEADADLDLKLKDDLEEKKSEDEKEKKENADRKLKDIIEKNKDLLDKIDKDIEEIPNKIEGNTEVPSTSPIL